MTRRCANWLSTYLDYTKHTEAPEQFHFWTGVSTIAGALRRKAWFDMGHFQWTPNFFIFLVAPPAIVSKSTSANIGAKLLMQCEDVRFGPSSVTWQALLDAFSASLVSFPMTPDGLMGDHMDMCALSIFASELGTFLDPKNREMIDLMNDIWDGKEIPFKRRTRGEGEKVIVNPWINLLACTTPGWLADNVTPQFASGGLASRSVFVYAEVKRQLVPYPFLQLANGHDKQAADLINDLQHIAAMKGAFHLTQTAINWGQMWYEEHYKKLLTMTDRYRGHIDRKQTHLHKLAMVLSASRRDDMLLTAEDMIEADKQLTALEPDIPRVFANMNKEKEADIATDFVTALKQCKDGRAPREAFFRHFFFKRLSYDTFNNVMDSAVESGTINQEVTDGKITLVLNEKKLLSTAKELTGHD